ncbi:hypothetical protein [uncultured Marixanthomonas sp.]|uniref:hypothetical protein n=1 Tax=uncultured Marixanthomonas sp. TaxID=757245 RepID=UPI0030DAAC20|tara:strand:+ start:614 stop:805 length:192 start_codon:yes stop_codon:yes gene_type:complete
MKNIYQLALNEEVTIDNAEYKNTNVRRVPGGWLYTTEIITVNDNDHYTSSLTSAFVPFSKQIG